MGTSGISMGFRGIAEADKFPKWGLKRWGTVVGFT